jgi:hypothetical protein
MEEAFKDFAFSIGSVVALKASATQTIHEQYGTGQWRFCVVEQVLSRSQFGFDRSYFVRAVNPSGERTMGYERMLEVELVESEPFQRKNPERATR